MCMYVHLLSVEGGVVNYEIPDVLKGKGRRLIPNAPEST